MPCICSEFIVFDGLSFSRRSTPLAAEWQWLPGYRTRAVASAIWKTAYPLWLACSGKAAATRRTITGRLSSFTALQLHSLTAAEAIQYVCGWSRGKICVNRRRCFRDYRMSGVTYVLCRSPLATTGFFHVCPAISLHHKQLINLYDRTVLSILPHLESWSYIRCGWHERPVSPSLIILSLSLCHCTSRHANLTVLPNTLY